MNLQSARDQNQLTLVAPPAPSRSPGPVDLTTADRRPEEPPRSQACVLRQPAGRGEWSWTLCGAALPVGVAAQPTHNRHPGEQPGPPPGRCEPANRSRRSARRPDQPTLLRPVQRREGRATGRTRPRSGPSRCRNQRPERRDAGRARRRAGRCRLPPRRRSTTDSDADGCLAVLDALGNGPDQTEGARKGQPADQSSLLAGMDLLTGSLPELRRLGDRRRHG